MAVLSGGLYSMNPGGGQGRDKPSIRETWPKPGGGGFDAKRTSMLGKWEPAVIHMSWHGKASPTKQSSSTPAPAAVRCWPRATDQHPCYPVQFLGCMAAG
eukprot:350255-Chlamydomonas_euryale.AAC.29